MNRFTIPFLGILLVALVAACGSTHKELDRPREEIAELHGISPEFALLGTTRTLLFTSLDGVPFEKSWAASHPDVLDVLPGKHRVGIYYSVKLDGQSGPSGELEAEVDAQAGKIYQAELLHSDAKGWYVEFHEAAPKPRQVGATDIYD